MQVALGACPKETYMDSKSLLLTYTEAAALLACSARTLRRLVSAGKLIEVRVTSDAPRLRRADIELIVSSSGSDKKPDETRLS